MSIDDEIAALDAALRARRLAIWIGAEPTFTRADSLEPCWLSDAEGGDKEERARALLVDLAPRLSPVARLCRAAGRRFPEEPRPRFAFGAAFARDGSGAAGGSLDGDPADPLPPGPDLAWMTVTPDPGVVEINLPPAPDLITFAATIRATHEAARAAGLSAVRHRWNGDTTDSGGGGQITLGGPTPENSPFFQSLTLLPSLLAYANAHPALSFWFAPECVGSASQGPRPDQGDPQRFAELGVTLARLAAQPAAGPAQLWANLAPLLVDGSGNSHRAEINIEKLWNPHIPERGQLGLVELRALRMEPTAERMVAVAALLRALAARLALDPFQRPLVDWGKALHDRYGLPFFLAEDLRQIIQDLAAHDLPLGNEIESLLLALPEPLLELEDGDASLTISPAREFWPLVGDVASQERRASRVVDASTARIEIRATTGDPLTAAGRPVALHPVVGGHIAAVRWRTFAPKPGFHPDLPPIDPLVLTWRGLRIALCSWRPGGGAYTALPADADDARARRRERVVVTRAEDAEPTPPPAPSRSYTVDLRLP